MARKRKKSGTRTKSRKKYSRRKSGFMGIGSLPPTQGTTGQKILRGGLKVLTAVVLGGAAGAYAGKYSGAAGLALAMGAEFAPASYKDYVQAAGLGMIIASPKMIEQTDPQAAATAAATTAATGVSGMDDAGFHEQGVSRVKNFVTDLASKAWVDQPVKKYLGIGEMPEQVSYYGNASLTQSDYERLFNKALAEGQQMANQQISGYDQMSKSNLLAGFGAMSSANIDI